MSRHDRRFPCIDHHCVVKGVDVTGTAEKDLLDDPRTGDRYIAKLVGWHNDVEVMTEFAIHLIGRSIGVPVAETRIARYRGRLRLLSRNFLKDGEELVHGAQFVSSPGW